MTKYAYVVNNVAQEVVRVDPSSIFNPGYAALFIEVPDEVEAGWLLTDGEWSPPVVIVIKETKITRLAFRNRFTVSEKVMLDLASIDDPSAEMSARQQSAALRVYLTDLASASFVDLTDAATIAGVQMLEAIGLIAEGRSGEILSDVIADGEKA